MLALESSSVIPGLQGTTSAAVNPSDTCSPVSIPRDTALHPSRCCGGQLGACFACPGSTGLRLLPWNDLWCVASA